MAKEKKSKVKSKKKGAEGSKKKQKGTKEPKVQKKQKKVEEEDDDEEIDEDIAFADGDDDKYGDVLDKIARRVKGKFEIQEASEPEEDEIEDALDKAGGGSFLDDFLNEKEEEAFDATDLLAKLEEQDDVEDVEESKPSVMGGLGAEADAGMHFDEAISTDDILATLADASGMGALKQQLEGLKEEAPLRDAGGSVKQEREDRVLRYGESKKLASHWVATIVNEKQSEQVVLGNMEGKSKTQASLVHDFQPTNDFEREVQEAIKASGLGDANLKNAAALPMEDKLQREKHAQQVQHIRALMMREAVRNKRINKIKSKTYRKIKNRAEQRMQEKLLERLDQENPEMAAKLREEHEVKYAKARLMRQQVARQKWSTQAYRFGGREMRKEISAQAQKMNDEKKALERMVKGKTKDSDSESGEEVDLSGDEMGEGPKSTVKKATKLTLDELKAQENEDPKNLPKTGVMGMKFMRDAIARKREEAKENAEKLLKDLSQLDKTLDNDEDSEADSESDVESKPSAPKAKTAEEVAEIKAQVDALLAEDDLMVDATEVRAGAALNVKSKRLEKAMEDSKGAVEESSKKRRKREKVAAPAAKEEANPWISGKSKPITEDAPEESNPWVALSSGSSGSKQESETSSKAKASSSKSKEEYNPWLDTKATAKKDTKKSAPVLEADSEDEHNIFSTIDQSESSQTKLIQEVFAKTSHEKDFNDEHAPKEVEEDDKMFGWGSWAGEGIKKKPKKKILKRDDKIQAAQPHVRVFTGTDKKAQKYCLTNLPKTYDSAQQYEATMKMPVGLDWNTTAAHKRLIQPKVVTRVGAVVAPIQMHKHLSTNQRDSLIDAWAHKPKKQRTQTAL